MSETRGQRPHKLLVPATLFSFSLLAACALAQSSTPQHFDDKPYIAPEHLVEIAPGHHLDLHCTGVGSPTIILEAGYAGDSTAWRFVQPILAKHTRVCSYDRAGERFSDPGPYPRDLEAMSKDLHALVLAAHIAKPFVLVGHSMGGMTALLYADNYRNDLAGLVLLDPGTMYDFSRFSALQDWPQYVQNSNKGFAGLRHCIELASNPSKTEQVLKDCNWRDASFPPQLNATQDELVERSSFWRSLLSTDLALRATGTDYQSDTKEFFGRIPGVEHALNGVSSLDQTELQENNKSLGTLPLLIVSVAERPDPPRPITTVHNEWAIKTKNYEDLTKLSTRSQLVPISGTGHNMQLDVPDKTAALVLAFIGHPSVLINAVHASQQAGPAQAALLSAFVTSGQPIVSLKNTEDSARTSRSRHYLSCHTSPCAPERP